MSNNKCKVEITNQLPETGLTRVQFKTWKESMIVYLKQNDNFLHFLSGGKYENWQPAEENENRIAALHADDYPAPAAGADAETANATWQKNLPNARKICSPC